MIVVLEASTLLKALETKKIAQFQIKRISALFNLKIKKLYNKQIIKIK